MLASAGSGGLEGMGLILQLFILYRAAYFYKERKNNHHFKTPTNTVVSVLVFVTFFRDHFSAFLYKIKI